MPGGLWDLLNVRLPASLGSTGGVKTQLLPAPQTPTAYRTGITTADVMAAPGTVTCTKQAGGANKQVRIDLTRAQTASLTAGLHGLALQSVDAQSDIATLVIGQALVRSPVTS